MTSSAASSPEAHRLTGRITRVLVRRDDADWVMALLRTRDGDTVRVTGSFVADDLQAPELTVWGRFAETDSGRVFRVDRAWRGEVPTARDPSPEAVEAFAAEFFRGHHFGPASAEKLVQTFRSDSWAVLTREPMRLAEHLGDPEKARALTDRLMEEGVVRAASLARLMGQGLTLAYAQRVYDAMGAEGVEAIAEDPYRMIGVPGIGFATADKMAREGYGIDPSDPRRLKAMAVAVLEDAAGDGHTSMAEGDVLDAIAALEDLEGSDLSAADVLRLALEDGVLGRDMGDIYLPRLLRAERQAAEHLARMLLRTPDSLPEGFWSAPDLERYTPEQKQAIAMGLTFPLLLISGPPGTGKTTVAREIVRLARDRNLDVTLAATTGKAADRLTESLREAGPGRALERVEPARTIHSLTGFGTASEPDLPSGIVIVDEASMMDLPLLARTLRAATDETRLVFLGDPNQLPPVMAGNSSRDIRDAMVVPTIALTRVHRQDRNTLIAINAERTLRGQMPLFYGQSISPRALDEVNAVMAGPDIEPQDIEENAYFLEAGEPEDGAALIVRVVRRLEEKGYDPVRDVQVYTPMHKGEMGTRNLNRLLQDALNPEGDPLPRTDRYGLELRVGDPVLQTRNDKEGRNVVNGMRGVVLAPASASEDGALVAFGERKVPYTPGQVGELALAYATTVHKGQGQEQPVSVLALHHSEHAVLLDRSLLYVAGTRAREMLVYVATKKALWMALNQERGNERRTRLAERTTRRVQELQGEGGEQVELALAADSDHGMLPPLLRERTSLILGEGPPPERPSHRAPDTDRTTGPDGPNRGR